MRCLLRPVRMDHDVGQPVNGWRWVTDNGWSPIPDEWFSSPEEALKRFREAAG